MGYRRGVRATTNTAGSALAARSLGLWTASFIAAILVDPSTIPGSRPGDLDLATTDVVPMEVLAGARDEDDRVRLKRLLYSCVVVPVEGPLDPELAAQLYRHCQVRLAPMSVSCSFELSRAPARASSAVPWRWGPVGIQMLTRKVSAARRSAVAVDQEAGRAALTVAASTART
jgi:hypothetical protein